MATALTLEDLPEQLQHVPGPLGRAFAWALVRGLCALPPAVRESMARGLGRLVYALGIRRAVTLDNLRHAYPELSDAERVEIAKGSYRSMALAAIESLTAERIMAKEKLGNLVMPPKIEEVRQILASGQGIIMATAHIGSWELFGALMLKAGLPLYAVVRPLKGAVNRRIMFTRVQAGMKLIPPRGAIQGIGKAIKEGGLVAVLIDQVIAADKGVFVDFFGRAASTAPALAVAAQRTGAPIYFIGSIRKDDGLLHLHIEGPLNIPDSVPADQRTVAQTARVAGVIEALVRRYPSQWLWLHRRWKVSKPTVPESQEKPAA